MSNVSGINTKEGMGFLTDDDLYIFKEILKTIMEKEEDEGVFILKMAPLIIWAECLYSQISPEEAFLKIEGQNYQRKMN